MRPVVYIKLARADIGDRHMLFTVNSMIVSGNPAMPKIRPFAICPKRPPAFVVFYIIPANTLISAANG